MSKRLIVVAFCILILPMLASMSHIKNSDAAGTAMVAFAGHIQPGGAACTCGTAGCSCDPGELPARALNDGVTSQPDDKTLASKTPSSEADYGTGALLLALALLVWLRLRA